MDKIAGLKCVAMFASPIVALDVIDGIALVLCQDESLHSVRLGGNQGDLK